MIWHLYVVCQYAAAACLSALSEKVICETDGANGAEYGRETSSGIHLTTPIVSSFTPMATTRSQEHVCSSSEQRVHPGLHPRASWAPASRAETFEQAIVAVRTTTVHAMSGISIVGRDEVILLQWERDDSGGFICVHVVPCVNSPEHQLALTALGSTKE